MGSFSTMVRRISEWMYWLAAFSLAGVVFLTVIDVILRGFKRPVVGTYELVGFLGAWAIGFAIPKTSLDKGHVFMEFLVERVPGAWRHLLIILTRVLGVVFFALVGGNLFLMGEDLRRVGEVSLTLHLPQYPLAYGVGMACLMESLVLVTEIIKLRSMES